MSRSTSPGSVLTGTGNTLRTVYFCIADPEYLAFVEQLAKPAEYLPSAEIQLERRDAEKAAALGMVV